MPYPEERKTKAKKDKDIIRYSIHQYQNLNSLLHGYYCLYFFNETNKRKTFYKVLKPFSLTDTI